MTENYVLQKYLMRIAVINIPFKTSINGQEGWITIPPQGYGGIQWMVATHIDALIHLGHSVFLLGAPGSDSYEGKLNVIDIASEKEITEWLNAHDVDIIHDFSDGKVFHPERLNHSKWLSTHHFTSKPRNISNTVYVSYAQRKSILQSNAPVVRIPVNPSRYTYNTQKSDYLLFLGRVSPWKGTKEAAEIASKASKKLLIAGPCWEQDYVNDIKAQYSHTCEFIGEVGGEKRLELLSQAEAVLVMSQTVQGPWGNLWCEPGATVVSEAGASGTPVIASDNGCLPEIVPSIGKVLTPAFDMSEENIFRMFEELPSPEVVYQKSIEAWDYITIANEYINLYQRVIEGERWD